MSAVLPDPSLTSVYRLEATLGEPLELGDSAQGRRRIVPLTGGTFAGPELNDLLGALPLADWLRVTVTPLEAHPNDPATAAR